MSAADPAWEIPNHRLIRVIGSGAYGTVWLAYNATADEHRAVKIIEREQGETNAETFQRELEGLRRFQSIGKRHAGLLHIHEIGADESRAFFYYIMELADRARHWSGRPETSEQDWENYRPRTLRSRLAEGDLAPSEVLSLVKPLAQSLAILHQEDWVHRDVKPQNVIFVRGVPKLADIGLMACVGASEVVGTSGYATSGRAGLPAGDWYGLGKILYQLLTRNPAEAFPSLPEDLASRGWSRKEWGVFSRLNRLAGDLCAYASTPAVTSSKEALRRLHRVERFAKMHAARRRAWQAITLLGGSTLAVAVYAGTVERSLPALPLEKAERPAAAKVPSANQVPFTIPDLQLRMLWVDAGSFQMGAPASEPASSNDERPQHQVTLSQGFWLAAHETTQAQFDVVILGRVPDFENRLPVSRLTWRDARSFCQELNKRERAAARLPEGYAYTLPTEAQWEYACRAGTTSAIPTGRLTITGLGHAPALESIAWYEGNSHFPRAHDEALKPRFVFQRRSGAHPVGLKAPNAWGFHDMLGNVSEWCRDWYASYPVGDAIDPTGGEATLERRKVVRGGSWTEGADHCHSSARASIYWEKRSSDLGFRVCLSWDVPPPLSESKP